MSTEPVRATFLDDIRRLHATGMNAHQIASELGGVSTPNYVAYLLQRHGAPRPLPAMPIPACAVPNAVYMKFVAAAQRRKETLDAFIMALLIASSECIDAVRDD